MKRLLLALLPAPLAVVLLLASPAAASQPFLSGQGELSATVWAAQVASLARPLPGRLLFVKDGDLWLWERDSARQFTKGGTWRQPEWSPDGTRIAYVYQGPYFSDVYVMPAGGGDHVRLTRSQAFILQDNSWAFRPTWSPQGSQLAYTSDAASYNPTLWLMNADGGNKRRLLATRATLDAVDGLSWSPDGKHIAAAAFLDQVSQILVVDTATGAPKVLTQVADGALDPAWSPDGSWIAYVARGGGRTLLHLMAADGSASRPISDRSPVRAPAWSPDGRHLTFLAAEGGTFDIWAMEVARGDDGLQFSNLRQLTRGLGVDAVSGLSWSP